METQYKIALKCFYTNKEFFFKQGAVDSDEILLNVSHQQQMYKPSCLEVELQTSNKCTVDFKDHLITLSDNKRTYAKDYFVVNVRKKGQNVKLKAYSADYFLTIDKFCQAFTAKKLVEEILNPTLQSCKSRNFDNFRKIASSVIDGENKKNYVFGNIVNFLSKGKESKIPYAVQYNESFYDFMVRMCNRDGEFLYMDTENKLRVGLKSTGCGEVFTMDDAEYIDSYEEIDDSSWTNLDYLGKYSFNKLTKEEAEKEATEEFEDKLLKNEKKKNDRIKFIDERKVEISEEKKKNLDYIKSFNTQEKSGVINNMYILAPEYLEEINEDREPYFTWNDLTNPVKELTNVFFAFANERTVSQATVSCLKTITENDLRYGHIAMSIQHSFNKTYGKKTLYSSDRISRCNESYRELYEKQEKVKATQVRISKSGAPTVSLGDVVMVSGLRYVVNKVESKSILNSFHEYESEYEIHLLQQLGPDFYPLPMPEIRIKKASAQRAKVVDSHDPSRLGRVRVVYPWQNVKSEDDCLKKLLKKSDSEYDSMSDDDKEEKKDKENRNDIKNMMNSTPWIRVSSSLASIESGCSFTPTKNDEVLIDYEEGNIERPYVCGSFYNETNRPSPASQSSKKGVVKSITSANGHHISFSDTGGGEKFLQSLLPITKALLPFDVIKGKIDSDDSKHFGGGFEIADYYGIYSISGSTPNRSIDINSPFGKVSINAFTGITIDAPLGDVKIVGKNVTIEARNNLKIESGTNIKDNFFRYKSENDFSWEDAFNDYKSGLVSSVKKVALGFVDISLFRHMLEVFLRPIGGTMLIKSNRYLRFEAGEGKTSTYYQTKDKGNNISNLLLNRTSLSPLQQAKEDAVKAMDSLTSFIQKLKDDVANGFPINKQLIKDNSAISKKELKKLFDNSISDEDKQRLSSLRDRCEGYCKEYKELSKKLDINYFKAAVDDYWSYFKNSFGDPNSPNSDSQRAISNLNAQLSFSIKQLVIDNLKNVVGANPDYKYLNISEVTHETTDNELKTKVVILENANSYSDELESKWLKAVKIVSNVSGFTQSLDDKVWSKKDVGSILISDSKESFFRMNHNGHFVKSWNQDYKREIIDIIKSIPNPQTPATVSLADLTQTNP